MPIRHFHIIIPHLYGSGKEADKVYHLQKSMDAVTEIIKTRCTGKVMLVGFSLGASLAAALVAEHAELFCSAIFISGWLYQSRLIMNFYKVTIHVIYTPPTLAMPLRLWALLRNMPKARTEEIIHKRRLKRDQQRNRMCKTEVWKGAGHNIPYAFSDRLNRMLLDMRT